MNALTNETADQSYRHVTALIRRYPELSDEELRELIATYSELSAVELALLISNEEIASNLDAFHREHRRKFRTPFRQYAVLVGILVAGVAVVVWTLAFAA